MAVIITPVKGSEGEAGRLRFRVYDVTVSGVGAPTTYLIGGITITPDDVGLLDVYGAHVINEANISGAAKTTHDLFTWDNANKKFQLWETGAAPGSPFAEHAASSIAALTFRIMFYGI